jgi:phosphoglycolate phosphatase
VTLSLRTEQANRIRHVIFDFDGTIVDSLEVAVQLINQAAEKYHYRPINSEDFEKLRRMSIPERFKALDVSPYHLPRIGLELTRNYAHSLSSIKIFDGMREVILTLKERGLTLSIISSNSNQNIRKFLIENKLDVFDHIYCAKNLFGKERTIGSLIKKLNLKRQELIYVGDEHRDIIACQANHIQVIAVTWGFDTLETLAKAQPNYIAHQPADIISIIDAI